MSLNPYPEGYDCLWIASDRNGHLGAFFTAGRGPIPAVVLAADQSLFDGVEAQLRQLPTVSQVHMLVSIPAPNDFLGMAERGFFVYDWTDAQRPLSRERNTYDPVAIPSAPITADALPAALADWVRTVMVVGATFSAGGAMDIRAHFDCVESTM